MWRECGKLGRRGRAGAALSCAAFFWASSWAPSPAQEQPASPPAAASAISASELSRLVEISTRLSALTERLKAELEDSRLSSAGLASSLETSRSELEALRTALESSRRDSTELSRRAESSELASTALREALRKAEGSLLSSERSFGELRDAAEAAVRKERTRTIVAAVAAAAGWAVALLSLLFR